MKKRSSNDLINDLINEGRVKLHKFQPSGRELWTVIGNYGDHLILINDDYIIYDIYDTWIIIWSFEY